MGEVVGIGLRVGVEVIVGVRVCVLVAVGVPSPDDMPIEADLALRPGLKVLASLDEGAALVQAFADGSVRLFLAPVADIWRLALHLAGRRTVMLAVEVAAVSPSRVAKLLAHEGAHVRRDVSGRLANHWC